MKLTKALENLLDGNGPAIRVEGKRYTVQMLKPKRLGKTVFVFERCGMTKKEREGEWTVCQTD